jgi:hypothetical protein
VRECTCQRSRGKQKHPDKGATGSKGTGDVSRKRGREIRRDLLSECVNLRGGLGLQTIAHRPGEALIDHPLPYRHAVLFAFASPVKGALRFLWLAQFAVEL